MGLALAPEEERSESACRRERVGVKTPHASQGEKSSVKVWLSNLCWSQTPSSPATRRGRYHCVVRRRTPNKGAISPSQAAPDVSTVNHRCGRSLCHDGRTRRDLEAWPFSGVLRAPPASEIGRVRASRASPASKMRRGPRAAALTGPTVSHGGMVAKTCRRRSWSSHRGTILCGRAKSARPPVAMWGCRE